MGRSARGYGIPAGVVTTSEGSGWMATAWTVLRRAADGSRRDNVVMTAQALAFSLFLAIPSTLLVVLGVFSLVADASDVSRLIGRAERIMPAEAATLLGDSLERSTESLGGGLAVTLVGLALALWSASSAATTLMQGITTAYGTSDERGFLRKRVIALVLVASLVGAALLVVFFLVLGPHVEQWIGGATNAPSLVAWVWWTAQWPLLVIALLFLFAVLLYLGPDAEQHGWKLVTPGAVVALVAWLVVSGGFAVYTSGFGSYNKAWGTLSAVVVTLLWLWLSSASLLFGAEVNVAARRLATDEEQRERHGAVRRR